MINRTAQKKRTLVIWGTNLLGVLAALATIVAAYRAHNWLRRERELVQARQRDDMVLLARAEQVQADRESAAKQLATLAEQLADLKSRLPSSPKEAEFLAQLSKLAENTGVRLKNFRPGQVANGPSVNTCEVQLSLVGPFASICKMFDGLAEVPRFLSVARVTLAGPPSAGDACIADVTISLCFAAAATKQ
ncbi:MAG TPA: type 4a pilus biogenesis protein PilO [Pirellulaceae bacterium]|jgi:Tfp pilus assembly protein PilO